MTETIKLVQKKLGVAVDGIAGKKTWAAIAAALGVTNTKAVVKTWPTQAQVRTGKSIFGKAGDESNLVNIKPAYQLYYCGTPVKTIRVHKLIAKDVEAALKEILAHYGLAEIKRLGLDQYSGSYNYRKSTNGKSMSMHAWGIALDFAADKNTYKMKKPQASLSHPDCNKWWKIWEKHGAVSLGRQCNYDWMHLQFAKLK
ncbi:MAG: M15 family metallopeptidase [Oscillospiraceae bacterium]|nr:M15 family metallopeptidase [Oscillospiraceae bacterium]